MVRIGGASLPNAKVRDLDYDSTADTLLVGLQGRGAWVMKDVVAVARARAGPRWWWAVLGSLIMIRRRRGTASTN